MVPREEVTGHYANLVEQVRHLADQIAGAGATHEIHLYQAQATSGADGAVQTAAQAGATLAMTRVRRGARGSLPPLDLILHLTVAAEAPLSQVHLQAEQIKRALRDAYPTLEATTIHTEPPGQ